jgi:hypothetical protein
MMWLAKRNGINLDLSDRAETTPSKREIKEGQHKKGKPKIIRLTFALASLVAVTIASGKGPSLRCVFHTLHRRCDTT